MFSHLILKTGKHNLPHFFQTVPWPSEFCQGHQNVYEWHTIDVNVNTANIVFRDMYTSVWFHNNLTYMDMSKLVLFIPSIYMIISYNNICRMRPYWVWDSQHAKLKELSQTCHEDAKF